MDESAFWQQKLIQFFHDPPAKPYAFYPGSGGHRRIAAGLFERFTGVELRYVNPVPDWAMAGADRPILTVPRGLPGRVQVYWPSQPYVTHPLSADYLLDVRRLGEAGEPRAEAEARRELRDELLADEIEVAEDLGRAFDDWRDPQQLRNGFFRVWRRFRDALVSRREEASGPPVGNLLWEEMPADTRCPDHSIWDHLKVATSLAFLESHKTRGWNGREEGARQPWLLSCSLGPTQRFITESRTSRDLWVSSYLLADLAWHAMEPLVERYGPDCIVYPDLRGNPRVDVWLYQHFRETLGEEANPSSFAAVLPNTFIALLPRGGQGHLLPLEDLAEKAQRAVRTRWEELADIVRQWLRRIVMQDRNWEGIWRRQHQEVIYTIWSAVPWLPPGQISDPENLRGRALPAQMPGFREPSLGTSEQAEKDRETLDERRTRLAPWVPKTVWHRYEWAREVYAFSNLAYHQMERGYDYALTHHQLRVRHALRKATASDTLSEEEPGEKCTLCGHQQALTGDNASTGDGLDRSRKAAQVFWSRKQLDPDENGHERLCAVCAMKRFLIQADQNSSTRSLGSFNELWAGPATDFGQIADRDQKVRVPFPSTATLAAQVYLAALVREPGLEPYLAGVVQACQQANLPPTSFPRALPRLAAARRQATVTGRTLLDYEAEDVLFPEVIEGKRQALQRRQPGDSAEPLQDLKQAAQHVRQEADRFLQSKPGTQIAVLKLDGDNMGRILLGEEQVIGARWRDVIHPGAIAQIEQSTHLLAAGWGDLLDAKRLMGPSLHAFVSRALAHFSHRIVPWVVEREFSGRLIYAGGDDVLCLAPANEAVILAARLQQLFSAAWIIDTAFDVDPWPWRRNDWQGEYDQAQARQRFAIPKMPDAGAANRQPIRLPVTDPALLEPHVDGKDRSLGAPVQGPILPMLGPWASLSAGIAFAHFKTPMSMLLRQAQHLLEDVAKDPFKDRHRDQHAGHTLQGRRAVALSHYSRGGLKTEFAMPWSDAGRPPEAHRILKQVRDAFDKGGLSSRLPYKLRALAASASYALEKISAGTSSVAARTEAEDMLLHGLFDRCVEQPFLPDADAAFRLWRAGIDLHRDQPDRYADGLLLCRSLVQGARDEGDDIV